MTLLANSGLDDFCGDRARRGVVGSAGDGFMIV
jgi:hypothetical protein